MDFEGCKIQFRQNLAQIFKENANEKKKQEYTVYIDYFHDQKEWTPVHRCVPINLALYLGASLGGAAVLITFG